MTMNYKTSRLNVVEVSGDGALSYSPKMWARITELLTPSVVESLPPYFKNIDTASDAEHWFEKLAAESRLFFVKLAENDSIIGFVFASSDNGKEARIGYLLGEAYWGQGLATELLQGFIKEIAKEKQWTKLIGGVDVTNTASSKLLLKLGFTEQEKAEGPVVFYEYQLS